MLTTRMLPVLPGRSSQRRSVHARVHMGLVQFRSARVETQYWEWALSSQRASLVRAALGLFGAGVLLIAVAWPAHARLRAAALGDVLVALLLFSAARPDSALVATRRRSYAVGAGMAVAVVGTLVAYVLDAVVDNPGQLSAALLHGRVQLFGVVAQLALLAVPFATHLLSLVFNAAVTTTVVVGATTADLGVGALGDSHVWVHLAAVWTFITVAFGLLSYRRQVWMRTTFFLVHRLEKEGHAVSMDMRGGIDAFSKFLVQKIDRVQPIDSVDDSNTGPDEVSHFSPPPPSHRNSKRASAVAPEPGSLTIQIHDHESGPKAESVRQLAELESGMRQPWMIDADTIKWGPVVSRGSYGEVFRGLWRGASVAIKKLHGADSAEEDVRSFADEIALLAMLRHPHIILFLGVCIEADSLALITEYMDCGSLGDIIHQSGNEIPFVARVEFAAQAAAGMSYLHSCEPPVLHHDLKPSNILVDSRWNVKVSDFGLAALIGDAASKGIHKGLHPAQYDPAIASGGILPALPPLKTAGSNVSKDLLDSPRYRREEVETKAQNCGTLVYMAPEIITMQPFTTSADVYSFGIVLSEIAACRLPFFDDYARGLSTLSIAFRVAAAGLRPILPGDLPKEFVDLVEACWDGEPSRRPGFPRIQEVLNKYVADNDFSAHQHSARLLPDLPGQQWAAATGAGSAAGVGTSDVSGTGPGGLPNAISRSSTITEQLSSLKDNTTVCAAVVKVDQGNRLWETKPETMREACKIASDVLRLLAREHSGISYRPQVGLEVGVFLFLDAKSAGIWAVRAQEKLLDAPWPEDLADDGLCATVELDNGEPVFRGLRIGIALHSGTLRVTDEQRRSLESLPAALSTPGLAPTFDGPVIVESMELLALTNAGDILVSSAMWERLAEAKWTQSVSVASVAFRTHDEFGKLWRVVPTLVRKRLKRRYSKAPARPGDSTSSSALGSSSGANMAPWMVQESEILFHQSLGVGTFGETLKGLFRGREVAVKRLFGRNILASASFHVYEDLSKMWTLSHPNVVRIIGAVMRSPSLTLVMEFAGRNLRSLLDDPRCPWTTRLRRRILNDVVLGMNYLHEQGVLHGDLKSRNVMVMENLRRAKVTDYGMRSAKFEMGTAPLASLIYWTAPEVLHGDKLTKESDVYSLGVVMFELATHRLPYPSDTVSRPNELFQFSTAVFQGRRPRCEPAHFVEGADWRAVMEECWDAAPEKRPTFRVLSESIAGELIRAVDGQESLSATL